MADSGKVHQAVTNEFKTTTQTINEIVQSRQTLEKLKDCLMKRKNLDLNDKLKIIRFMYKNNNAAKVGRICKANPRTVLLCWKNRNVLAKLSTEKIPGTVKRPLKPRFPAIELGVGEFIRYIRSQRLPVTSSHVKACALRAAQALGISNFRPSNGWLQKFLRPSGVQSSFKLHGKGSSELPASTSSRMEEICNTLSTYEISNIYNMDESGLFYRIGPFRT